MIRTKCVPGKSHIVCARDKVRRLLYPTSGAVENKGDLDSLMIPGAIHQLLLRLGWDPRCRNLGAAHALKPILSKGQILLDAGCGEYGLAEFIGSLNVVGTDIILPPRRGKNRLFLQASITALPFADLSLPVAASVDVLEHLPPAARDEAVAELVRVARNAILIAFPCGHRARQTDEAFHRRLVELDKAQPDWLIEHLQNPYPSVESVSSKIKIAAMKYQRAGEIKVSYSEHIKVTRILRWAASRSRLLYIGLNLLAGLLISIIPPPNENNSYRAVLLVMFQ